MHRIYMRRWDWKAFIKICVWRNWFTAQQYTLEA